MSNLNIAIVGAGIVGANTILQSQENFPNAQITLIDDKFSNETTSYGPAGILISSKHHFGGVEEEVARSESGKIVIYQCLHCMERPTFRNPLDYILHLLWDCLKIENMDELPYERYKVIKFIILSMKEIRKRLKKIRSEKISGKSLEICMFYKSTAFILLPVVGKVKCVICAREDNGMRASIDHLFSSHLSTNVQNDALRTLVIMEQLFNEFDNLLDDLINKCIDVKSYMTYGLDNPSEEMKLQIYMNEAKKRTENYYWCKRCNFKSESKSYIEEEKHLNKMCKGQLPNLDCWFVDCEMCRKKRIFVTELEKHLLEDHKPKPTEPQHDRVTRSKIKLTEDQTELNQTESAKSPAESTENQVESAESLTEAPATSSAESIENQTEATENRTESASHLSDLDHPKQAPELNIRVTRSRIKLAGDQNDLIENQTESPIEPAENKAGSSEKPIELTDDQIKSLELWIERSDAS